MNKRLMQITSYLLVAAFSAAVTLACITIYNSKSKLNQIEKLIEKCFIGEYDSEKTMDMTASAMIASLGDRWSYYIPASEYKEYTEQMENSYVGVGITISQNENGNGFLVESVNKDGPAADAGMLPGDILISVDGNSTEGMTTSDVRELVRGKVNTTVTVTVLRMGEAQTLYITRKRIETTVAEAIRLTDTIGMVKIYNFDSRCADETIRAIDSLMSDGVKMLLFDVRFNPGGYADELVKILDYLLPEGELFKTVDYAGREVIDRSDAKCLDIPMAVLVNKESYSAAEFFAAAMSEYDAAKVIGEQTSGKGYFQNTFRLSDGSAVGLSVGKYYTPKGNSLAGVGIVPDTIVTVDEETAAKIYLNALEPEEDPQIQEAVSYLNDVWQKKNS